MAATRAEPSRTTSRAHVRCLELVRPARGTEQPSPHSQRPRGLLNSSQPLVSCGAYHQRTSSCSQHPRQTPPLPDLALAPTTAPQPPRPGTRLASHPSHTRPCVRRPPDVHALERDQDEEQAHQADPRQAGAQNSHRAHSPCGRAPRAPITTRSPIRYSGSARTPTYLRRVMHREPRAAYASGPARTPTYPTYLSPIRHRWVAPFCSSGLSPSA